MSLDFFGKSFEQVSHLKGRTFKWTVRTCRLRSPIFLNFFSQMSHLCGRIVATFVDTKRRKSGDETSQLCRTMLLCFFNFPFVIGDKFAAILLNVLTLNEKINEFNQFFKLLINFILLIAFLFPVELFRFYLQRGSIAQITTRLSKSHIFR